MNTKNGGFKMIIRKNDKLSIKLEKQDKFYFLTYWDSFCGNNVTEKINKKSDAIFLYNHVRDNLKSN